MATRLKNLKIMEVSSVDRGAGEGVRVVLMKRDADPMAEAVERTVALIKQKLTAMETAARRLRSGRDDRKLREAEIQEMSDLDDDEESEGDTMKTVEKAHADWSTAVDKVMAERKVTKSQAVDIVMREEPTLLALAKAARGAAGPRSNMSTQGTPSAAARRIDNEPNIDHNLAWAAAVDAIRRMHPSMSKSQAVDYAMKDSGARAHLEASKLAAQRVNAS